MFCDTVVPFSENTKSHPRAKQGWLVPYAALGGDLDRRLAGTDLLQQAASDRPS